uniref:Uncharacterized protein n=1 Tax=Faecalibaculum rodentium TaxID=1702221 RepID=A0A140DU64_9FIRM|nr:hypothetical protein AALO17_10570 [Faecalibaculum rodentium]
MRKSRNLWYRMVCTNQKNEFDICKKVQKRGCTSVRVWYYK